MLVLLDGERRLAGIPNFMQALGQIVRLNTSRAQDFPGPPHIVLKNGERIDFNRTKEEVDVEARILKTVSYATIAVARKPIGMMNKELVVDTGSQRVSRCP
jgi:hypothetical protein